MEEDDRVPGADQVLRARRAAGAAAEVVDKPDRGALEGGGGAAGGDERDGAGAGRAGAMAVMREEGGARAARLVEARGRGGREERVRGGEGGGIAGAARDDRGARERMARETRFSSIARKSRPTPGPNASRVPHE